MLIYKRNMSCPSIVQYTIFGERHSGTNFLQNILSEYFTDISITWEYGWKHWFGFTKHEKIIRSPRTLFIGIVRNPYNWICAMDKEPYHMPIQKNMRSLLLKQWISTDSNNKEILFDRNYYTGKAYKNIFELRRYKIHYLRQILYNICDNYVLLRYEDLLDNLSLNIQSIAEIFSINKVDILSNIVVNKKQDYEISDNNKNIIDTNIDWTIENTIGYYKRQ
jgi:hypothetical protein